MAYANRYSLLVDIDGTILINKPRKNRVLRHMLGENIDDTFCNSFSISKPSLGGGDINRDEFNKLFYSGRFLDEDVPYESAAEVLTEESKRSDIIYVTARHHNQENGDSMREGTLDWMRKNEFPVPDNGGVEILMIPFRDMDLRMMGMKRGKEKIVEKVSKERKIIGAVGDLPHDAEVYCKYGLRTFILRQPNHSEQEYNIYGQVVFVSDWREIKARLDEAYKSL